VTKILRCKDCCSEFVFDSKSQDFYAAHEWPDPIRCFECRVAHKKTLSAKRISRQAPCARVGDAVVSKLLGGKA